MPLMIVKHKVKDYEKWKMLFDVSYPVRKMNGEKSCRIFRSSEDPNDLAILFEWKDIEKAVRYSESEDLRAAMRESGVIQTPVVYLQDEDLDQ